MESRWRQTQHHCFVVLFPWLLLRWTDNCGFSTNFRQRKRSGTNRFTYVINLASVTRLSYGHQATTYRQWHQYWVWKAPKMPTNWHIPGLQPVPEYTGQHYTRWTQELWEGIGMFTFEESMTKLKWDIWSWNRDLKCLHLSSQELSDVSTIKHILFLSTVPGATLFPA